MDRATRRHLGQWFTPPHVADLALFLALEGRAAATARLVDPCCGDGAFLVRARAAGVLESALSGLDLDPHAVDAARTRLPGARVLCGDVFDTELGPVRFDAVVGNPPYVRQERLSKERKRAIRRALAQDVARGEAGRETQELARDLERLTGRADLAAACVVRALSLARFGARVALVVSSALLAADSAPALWRTVARLGCVRAIVDAPEERWFADAAVNAVILVIERLEQLDDPRPPVVVARLRVPTSEAAARVRSLADLAACADVRLGPADQPERWLPMARAPSVYFDFEALAGDALVPLGSLARLERRVTSGANPFFYLSRARAKDLGLEPSLLSPLLRSPREHHAIRVDPEHSSELAFTCPAHIDVLARHPAAERYVRAHEDLAERPTLRARARWWSLPTRPARLFFTKAYGERFIQRLASAPMIADQRVYSVHPLPGVDTRVLAGVLNSAFSALAIECLGRASMGEGALEWTVADAQRLPVLDPRRLDRASAQSVARALTAMERRPIGPIAEERSAADRWLLDRAVAAAHPGLEAALEPIWPALVRAVALRTERRTRLYR